MVYMDMMVLNKCRPKKSRTTRSKVKPRVEPTARDRNILLSVGVCQYLSTEQIGRELFPNLDRARRRLRTLYDAGYIRTIIWRSNESNLIRLTEFGWRYITEVHPEFRQQIRLPGPLREDRIPRHLLLVDTRLYAVAFGTYHNTPLSRWGTEDSTLPEDIGLAEWHLRPDAVAEFTTEDGPGYVAVLLDRDGRTDAVVLRQLRGYREAAFANRIHALWIVVAGERQQRWQRLLAEAELDEFGHILTKEALVLRPIHGRCESHGGDRNIIPDQTNNDELNSFVESDDCKTARHQRLADRSVEG
jgi:hypothetical protein